MRDTRGRQGDGKKWEVREGWEERRRLWCSQMFLSNEVYQDAK